ncbi:uncharacterized protein LDX57_004788 [Aspergillus melleus]|uniref:uncharacterized protein n=1 Tax=Aspergillus melleus TaxID=138277 RepID=UPI001E8D8B12|nr:uncharacterized protein LDX57_004788 [Aspergillus melleus]KAH8427070.1 hypothetical protein LDX57_004788 [Aspergillus melleus]
MTAANIKDPRCKKDADCEPGTCLKGICIDGAGPPNPKHTDFMFSIDDLDKIGMGHPSRRDGRAAGRKCSTNNDCAKDKKRPWCGTQSRCVAKRPAGTECHMDGNCKKGERCVKSRCVSKKPHVGRDEQEHDAVERLAPREEDEIVKDLGEEFGEEDEVSEQEHVKEKRMSHATSYELPGDAYDQSKEMGCDDSDSFELLGDAYDGGKVKGCTNSFPNDLEH